MLALIDWSVSVTNIIAAVAVVVSLTTLAVSISKDRSLKRTQYTDQIRSAAAILVAKLERWQALVSGIFEEIQPAITDADVSLVQNGDILLVRDKFWRDLLSNQLAISQRIREEEIEIAYASLYGYDPKVRDLFLLAMDRLNAIREITNSRISTMTQNDILGSSGMPVQSACLGNRLRETCAAIAIVHSEEVARVLGPFRMQMTRLIEAKDKQIVERAVVLSNVDGLFPPRLKEKESAASTVA